LPPVKRTAIARLVSPLLVCVLAALACGAARAEDSIRLRTDPGTALLAFADRHIATTRELALQALGFLGIRYKFGGSSPATGFDCSGFVRYVAGQALGLVLPHEARGISELGSKVSSEELQPGDLVFFNTMRRPYSHVGIYVGDQRFIHAPASGGTVELVSMSEHYWAARFNGARRLPQ
jgi:cell wall-associated NlpC family hydrolase